MKSYSRILILAAALAASLLVGVATTNAAPTAGSGYLLDSVVLSDSTQSCVAHGAGGVFVGVGPGFTGGAQDVLFVDSAGNERTVLAGLNSIGDCVYDRAANILYVTDNGGEVGTTGDTVFFVPDASVATDVAALGAELVPSGSIPGAASIVLDRLGDVLVANSTGGGSGSVLRISGGVMTEFISGGFDFTAGLAFDGDDLLVAESIEPSFENMISRFDADGNFVEVVLGPSASIGSFDLENVFDGRIAVTGAASGEIALLDTADGTTETLGAGFGFTAGVDYDPLTGRIAALSSTFTGAAEDSSIFELTPVSRGGGRPSTDCIAEYTGATPSPKKPGAARKFAFCRDGAPCDSDGEVNDVCQFPFGVCFDVTDTRLAECTPSTTSSFELLTAKPDGALPTTWLADVAAALPTTEPICVLSDGVSVSLKVNGDKRKRSKAVIKYRAVSTTSQRDKDKVKLVCRPAL